MLLWIHSMADPRTGRDRECPGSGDREWWVVGTVLDIARPEPSQLVPALPYIHTTTTVDTEMESHQADGEINL